MICQGPSNQEVTAATAWVGSAFSPMRPYPNCVLPKLGLVGFQLSTSNIQKSLYNQTLTKCLWHD